MTTVILIKTELSLLNPQNNKIRLWKIRNTFVMYATGYMTPK